MKRILSISIIIVMAAMILPLAFAPSIPAAGDELQPPDADGGYSGAEMDSEVQVRLLRGDQVENIDLHSYLVGVVAAEMPASFEEEALKAQSIAARTYTLYKMLVKPESHVDADVCDDYTCCKAYADEAELREKWGDNFDTYWAKIERAVTETDGKVLAFEGEPILAAFHSSSYGMTENCEDVWGSSLPYLVSADTPENEEDVPNYISSVRISEQEFTEGILSVYPEAVFSENTEEWIQDIQRSDTGRVMSLRTGGAVLEGTQIRSLFGLRSTNFDISFEQGEIVFTVRGYGHGVGMSQYGANAMAKDGATCVSILSNYYNGAELTDIREFF